MTRNGGAAGNVCRFGAAQPFVPSAPKRKLPFARLPPWLIQHFNRFQQTTPTHGPPHS